jgi:NADH:ubiquinone oxidoreductase subunit 6 (subunit J)
MIFTNLTDILFLGFSTNLILACILTISAYNAVSALMALIFAFLNATCLFFLMELEFIGLLFIILYLGAVCVLFLFSVMLFNLKDVVRTKTTSFILTNILIFFFIVIIFLGLFQKFVTLGSPQVFYTSQSLANEILINDLNINFPNSSIYFIGQILYGKYLIYLILASVILLVAMLGAVVLINNPKEQSQLQHSLHQITRTVQLVNATRI